LTAQVALPISWPGNERAGGMAIGRRMAIAAAAGLLAAPGLAAAQSARRPRGLTPAGRKKKTRWARALVIDKSIGRIDSSGTYLGTQNID
jgi:hypothetical protein